MDTLERNACTKVSDFLRSFQSLLDSQPQENPLLAKFIDTPMGRMVTVANDNALVFVLFAQSPIFDREMTNFIKSQEKTIVDDTGESKPLKSFEAEIVAYLAGDLREFKTPFELDPGLTDFQRRIFIEVTKIAYGKTITFTDIARKVGNPKGATSVAKSCIRNTLVLIVPNHRAISATKDTTFNSDVARRDWFIDHESKYTDSDED